MKTTETTPDHDIARDEAKALFDSLALTVTVSQPRPAVRDKNWPCIEYDLTFAHSRGGHFTTQYRLGVGHVQYPKRFEDIPRDTPQDMIPVFNTLRMHPGCQLKNKREHAEAAVILAKSQKVAPAPFEVFAQICNDGVSAQDNSFEAWASDFGYDSDSRKAEAIYNECRKLWFEATSLCGQEMGRKLAELASRF